jgi:hypothetical protein
VHIKSFLDRTTFHLDTGEKGRLFFKLCVLHCNLHTDVFHSVFITVLLCIFAYIHMYVMKNAD